MIVIPLVVLGYCTYRLCKIYNKGKVLNKQRFIPARRIIKDEPNRLETMKANIKANRQIMFDSMGPEHSLDPMAKMYAEEIKQMMKPGADQDPVVIETRKMIRAKFQQKKEKQWTEEQN